MAALEDVRGGSGLLGEGWRGEKLFSRLVRKVRDVGREVGGLDIYEMEGLNKVQGFELGWRCGSAWGGEDEGCRFRNFNPFSSIFHSIINIRLVFWKCICWEILW